MACRTPTVVSKFAGISEFLHDHRDCVITDPTNQEGFSAAIVELLQNKKLADRIGRAGLALVHDRFSWEAIAEKHIEFYRNLMNRPPDAKSES
jgi:glycosyltransferase involved in cell wall biosynthesis